jgi:hypothetical protein
MRARAHFRKGEMSPTIEAVTMVPTMTAAGVVIESMRLSSHGM